MTVADVELNKLMFYCILLCYNCVYLYICRCGFVIQPFDCNINKAEFGSEIVY